MEQQLCPAERNWFRQTQWMRRTGLGANPDCMAQSPNMPPATAMFESFWCLCRRCFYAKSLSLAL
jgi:hypothetical protein